LELTNVNQRPYSPTATATRREMQHFDVMGEPSIEIDLFKCINETERLYQYAGIHTGDIVFDRSQDGVYNIITTFAEVYDKEPK